MKTMFLPAFYDNLPAGLVPACLPELVRGKSSPPFSPLEKKTKTQPPIPNPTDRQEYDIALLFPSSSTPPKHNSCYLSEKSGRLEDGGGGEKGYGERGGIRGWIYAECLNEKKKNPHCVGVFSRGGLFNSEARYRYRCSSARIPPAFREK